MGDDKNKVSFISGLGFLLAVLALVLIGWGNMMETPMESEYKEYVENRFASLTDQTEKINNIMRMQMDSTANGHMLRQLYQLQELEANVGTLMMTIDKTYADDLKGVQAKVQALTAKIKAKQAGVLKPGDEVPDEKPAKGDVAATHQCDKPCDKCPDKK